MPLSVSHQPSTSHMVISMTGWLTSADYEWHVPRMERLLEKYGHMDVLVQMVDFKGWRPGGRWEKMMMDAKHNGAVGRVALIGDNRWNEWMLKLSRAFSGAKVRFFEPEGRQCAEQWLRGEEVSEAMGSGNLGEGVLPKEGV